MVQQRSIVALIYFTSVGSYCHGVMVAGRQSFVGQHLGQQRRKYENQEASKVSFLRRNLNQNGNAVRNLDSERGNSVVDTNDHLLRGGTWAVRFESEINQSERKQDLEDSKDEQGNYGDEGDEEKDQDSSDENIDSHDDWGNQVDDVIVPFEGHDVIDTSGELEIKAFDISTEDGDEEDEEHTISNNYYSNNDEGDEVGKDEEDEEHTSSNKKSGDNDNKKNGHNDIKNGHNDNKENGHNDSKSGHNDSENGQNDSRNGHNDSKNGHNDEGDEVGKDEPAEVHDIVDTSGELEIQGFHTSAQNGDKEDEEDLNSSSNDEEDEIGQNESVEGHDKIDESGELEIQGLDSSTDNEFEENGQDLNSSSNDEEDEVGKIETVEGHDIIDTSGEVVIHGFNNPTASEPSETERTQDTLGLNIETYMEGEPETTTTSVPTATQTEDIQGNTYDAWNGNHDGVNQKEVVEDTADTPWPGDVTNPETNTETPNTDDVWNDDKVPGEETGGNQSKQDISMPKEIKVEERRVRFLSASGAIFAIFAMIFTAYQMSENPDGFYAAMCRFCITVLVCIFRIVMSPCKGVFGYSNRHSHYGHVPVSTLDYGYRDPSVELQLQ